MVGIIFITKEGEDNIYYSEGLQALPARPSSKGSVETRLYKVTLQNISTISAVSLQEAVRLPYIDQW